MIAFTSRLVNKRFIKPQIENLLHKRDHDQFDELGNYEDNEFLDRLNPNDSLDEMFKDFYKK
jgi:hypothetical protein